MTETLHWTRMSPVADRAGESPLWDWRSERLFWIDAQRRLVRRLDPSTGQEESWTAPALIGCIGLGAGRGLVVALHDTVALLDCELGEWTELARVDPAPHGYRLNDGKVDAAGRLLVGSLFDGEFASDGWLYRFGRSGRQERLFGGQAIGNSLCFSPDGRMLYTGDTASADIHVCSYDPDSGALGERRLFLNTRDAFGGIPDGATTDSSGCVWLTLVDQQRIACIAPDGALVRMIETPMEYPSCPAFGGAALDTLYVTSIADPGVHAPPPTGPDSGALFALSGLGVSGCREPLFMH